MTHRTQRLLAALTLAVAIVIMIAFIIPEGNRSGARLIDDDLPVGDGYPVMVPESGPPPTYPSSGS